MRRDEKDASRKVQEAADGIEALEYLEAIGGGVDLVLTDVVMPRLGGRELTERIAVDFPEVGFLFRSGGASALNLVDTQIHGVIGQLLNILGGPVQLVDILPTVCAATGAAVPDRSPTMAAA